MQRRANVEAESTDLILLEALAAGLRVWEIDTTHRSPSETAHAVDQLLRRRPPPSFGEVDWLADPRVTDYLLRRTR